jgi:hypothetical protein
MAYLGNAPARSFISFERQVFTIVNSQTAYTLSHSVNNENDIRLVINNVVQEPGSGKAYTASGTTLTLSAALTNGTDEMYCVFLGRATATNAPGAGSVNTAAIAADAITEAKIADDAVESEHLNDNVISGQTALGAAPADTDEFLVSDAGVLKRMDYSYIKASSDFVHISTTTTAGASSVSLTGLDSTYKNYKILVNDCLVASGNGQLRFRFINSSGDITSSTYFAVYDGAYKPYNNSDAEFRASLYNQDYAQVAGNFDISNNNTNASSLEMYIPNPSDASGCPHAFGNVCTDSQNGSYMLTNIFAVKSSSTGAITGIKFYNQNGNNISGNFSLYGIKG